MAWGEAWSKAPTASTEMIVARASTSAAARRTRGKASLPARVLKPYWEGGKPARSECAEDAAIRLLQRDHASDSRLVAAGVPSPQPSSGSSRGRELSVRTPPFGRLCVRPMCIAGAASSPSLRTGPSPALCLSSSSTPSPLLPASRLCMRCCKTNAGCTPLPPTASHRGPRLLAQRRLQVHWDRTRTGHKRCACGSDGCARVQGKSDCACVARLCRRLG